MSNNNKTVIDNRTLNLEIVDAAAKSGQVLSVLIAPAAVKFFCKAVIVEFKPLPEEKNVALAVALRNRAIPFCAFDKALGGTLGSIPAEHLRGEAVQPKVYPPAQPATRPVVTIKAPKAEEPKVKEVKVEAPKEEKPKTPRARGGKKTVNPGVVGPEGAVG